MGRFSALALAVAVGAATPVALAQTSCPSTVDAQAFPSAAALGTLVAKEMSFGQRMLASRSHRKMIRWIQEEIRRIDDDFALETDQFEAYGWLPRTRAKGEPGLDIGRAGGLRVRGNGSTEKVPVAGAVHWSKPTSRAGQGGPLVYLGPEEPITAENAEGRVVIREFPGGSLPYVGFQILGLYVTPDLVTETGNYERPFINQIHQELLAAGQAGAAGVVFAFDVPREQVRGYYDPHVGTLYRVPAVFVGAAEAERLKALAVENASAQVVVRAKVKRVRTRNVIATLPGQSAERIIVAANTDGNSWVQENGVAGMLALARYFADMPMRCRPRTLVFVFASAHDTLVSDGTNRFAEEVDAEYDQGTVAFAFALEHLGTRELLPVSTGDGSGRRLEFTGKGETFLFSAGDSEALQQTAIAATQRRNLDRTAVMPGISIPVAGQVPPNCSMGGLGNAFHRRLIPTLAMISGPWSLYDPVFGSDALDFDRMRAQLLAAGDALLALDDLAREQIAGDYLAMREQRAQGAPTRPEERYPVFAPEPGATATQPGQPMSGSGSSDYPHADVRVSSGGDGADAWYVFEPIEPRPRRAPVAIVMHGYFEFSGYAQMEALIWHTVRKGNVVIYPRWQTDALTPCPGPFDIEPCVTSAANGIRGALEYLRSSSKRVRPWVKRTSYFGFSFGGIITANLANRYEALGLPEPRAILLDDPHDGALAGLGEPALDDSLAGIPSTTLFQCHAGADGVLSEPDQGGLAGTCNALFPLLGHIPERNKDLVLSRADTHGTPALSSVHGVCAGGPRTPFGPPDAYDWNFCWKVWDALRSCAYRGRGCRYALGDSRQHRSLGTWGDGVEVIPLKVQDEAPIAP